jgi:hypothetical protein
MRAFFINCEKFTLGRKCGRVASKATPSSASANARSQGIGSPGVTAISVSASAVRLLTG